MQHKLTQLERYKAADGGKGLYFILTNESIDRHGERVMAKGINIDNFIKNPVALAMHQSRSYQIGNWVDIHFEGTNLVAALEFKPDPDSITEQLQKDVTNGILRACSIGFISLKRSKEHIEDEDKRAQYEDLYWRDYIIRHDEIELLECSLVNIPSNPTALLRKAIEYNALNYKELNQIYEKAGAVLSQVNISKLTNIQRTIETAANGLEEVINSASKEEKTITMNQLESIINEVKNARK